RDSVVIVNYARAEHYSATPGRGYQVDVLDTLSGERFTVASKKIVDATGPWEEGSGLRLVRGSHIIIPRVNASENAIAFFEETGRIVFIIPWGSGGQFSLVGTTDCDHEGGPDNVQISRDEVEYLLGIVRRLFPSVGDAQLVAAFSSLRPLLHSSSDSATR